MSTMSPELQFLTCFSCEEIIPATCITRLIECKHNVCFGCLEEQVRTLMDKEKEWGRIVCPARNCRAAVHYNDIRDAVDKETFLDFSEKAEEALQRKLKRRWWNIFSR